MELGLFMGKCMLRKDVSKTSFFVLTLIIGSSDMVSYSGHALFVTTLLCWLFLTFILLLFLLFHPFVLLQH